MGEAGLSVGQRVCARWEKEWFRATVTASSGGKYTVAYDDGTSGEGLGEGELLPMAGAAELSAGARVYGCWNGEPRMFSGMIKEKTERGFIVSWDDGDAPSEVPLGELALEAVSTGIVADLTAPETDAIGVELGGLLLAVPLPPMPKDLYWTEEKVGRRWEFKTYWGSKQLWGAILFGVGLVIAVGCVQAGIKGLIKHQSDAAAYLIIGLALGLPLGWIGLHFCFNKTTIWIDPQQVSVSSRPVFPYRERSWPAASVTGFAPFAEQRVDSDGDTDETWTVQIHAGGGAEKLVGSNFADDHEVAFIAARLQNALAELLQSK